MTTSKPSQSPLDVQIGGSHYKDMKIQPIEFIHANGIPFTEGAVIKYVARWREKGGVSDLEKARHFIDLLIELESKAAAAKAVAKAARKAKRTAKAQAAKAETAPAVKRPRGRPRKVTAPAPQQLELFNQPQAA